MERRERAFREFAALVRAREGTFVDRVQGGLELGREVLDTEYASLARVDDGEHTVLALTTAADVPGDVGDSRPVDETYCEFAVLDGGVIAFGHPDDGPPGADARPAHAEDGFSAYVGAPVTVDDHVYGTCCFADSDSREPFADWEREFVAALAAWMGDGLTARARRLALASESDRLDGFAAMVDHDIGEPLSTARGHAQLAHEAATAAGADEVARHTEATVRALSRTDRLVDDLLRLASDSERAGGTAPVDVRTAAEHAWEEATGGDPAPRLLTESGVRVPADESLLKQLLAATFRFCLDTGGTDLRIRVGSLGDRPGFFVADDGAGFPGESGDRPADEDDGMEGIERIAAAHDWDVTAGLSAEGGVRIEFETDEGIWPTAAMPETAGDAAAADTETDAGTAAGTEETATDGRWPNAFDSESDGSTGTGAGPGA